MTNGNKHKITTLQLTEFWGEYYLRESAVFDYIYKQKVYNKKYKQLIKYLQPIKCFKPILKILKKYQQLTVLSLLRTSTYRYNQTLNEELQLLFQSSLCLRKNVLVQNLQVIFYICGYLQYVADYQLFVISFFEQLLAASERNRQVGRGTLTSVQIVRIWGLLEDHITIIHVLTLQTEKHSFRNTFPPQIRVKVVVQVYTNVVGLTISQLSRITSGL
ncbi:Hypothetical_protein [Hexamita inflata]|uniref:Hypothetical_protein n=1 Tax=Hexamita inflata TaxID=28002 RepID=A0AA86UIK8_9EUKA|nr:Hypothetical protein HINF_LOCUS40561 [Hexamita inflata]